MYTTIHIIYSMHIAICIYLYTLPQTHTCKHIHTLMHTLKHTHTCIIIYGVRL